MNYNIEFTLVSATIGIMSGTGFVGYFIKKEVMRHVNKALL